MVGVPNLHVLMVDPDVERRSAAADVLRSVGCRVDELDSAIEAARACRNELPAVVVVDEDACRADDLRMIDAIKRDPDLFSVGVIVRARRLDVDDALDGLARGAHGMLVDPVADAELVATVRSAARTGVLQEELRSRAIALERLAFTDALSGIPNRRFLDRQLEALVSSARRHERPLAVALVDIDRFKPVNDTHGHAIGDKVIAEVARRLGERLRTEDHLGRFGGEEFLVLLPETDAEAVAAVAESLRAEVCSRPIDTDDGPLDVTVSVGWAVWDDEPGHALVARADAALYEAKESGRNRVAAAPVRSLATEARTAR
ncbi:MAG: diguanylate cyclase [Solirubrobacterales bacterium]|nr:diguanylate cyclase [Solirubrobacterales bacterium]